METLFIYNEKWPLESQFHQYKFSNLCFHCYQLLQTLKKFKNFKKQNKKTNKPLCLNFFFFFFGWNYVVVRCFAIVSLKELQGLAWVVDCQASSKRPSKLSHAHSLELALGLGYLGHGLVELCIFSSTPKKAQKNYGLI